VRLNVFGEPLNIGAARAEHIYLKEYKDGKTLFEGLLQYIQFYNNERKHQALLYLTPNQVFNQGVPISKNSTILTKS